jgi:hypothetical protein
MCQYIVHSGLMFLPWHRWQLRQFEMDLKRADYLLGGARLSFVVATAPGGIP